MRGHVARNGNRYYAVVYEGTDPGTQRQRHRWYPGGPTRRDAEWLLGDLVKRLHDGDYRSPERIILGTYLTERWLPLRRSQVRHSTWAAYRRTIEHVIPNIGAIPLQRLTAEDIDGLYTTLLTSGKRNGGGGGLSSKTVRNIHNMLHMEEPELVGRRVSTDDRVFARPDGEPIHPDYFSQVFDRHLEQSTLPRFRLHDLRHASPAFTMTVYQDVLPGMRADAARTVSEAVFGDADDDE